MTACLALCMQTAIITAILVQLVRLAHHRVMRQRKHDWMQDDGIQPYEIHSFHS